MGYTDNEYLKPFQNLCKELHGDSVDKGGKPYWQHPFAVAERLLNMDMAEIETVAAAYLHDVIEDTETTAADLSRMGIPPQSR